MENLLKKQSFQQTSLLVHFQVTAIILEKNNKRFGDFFIATDATQCLPGFIWDDKDTIEDRTDDEWVPALDDQGNQKNVDSYGYGFHAGGYTGEDPLKE
jgi:hypothetical protein